jgi:hypothetical protein
VRHRLQKTRTNFTQSLCEVHKAPQNVIGGVGLGKESIDFLLPFCFFFLCVSTKMSLCQMLQDLWDNKKRADELMSLLDNQGIATLEALFRAPLINLHRAGFSQGDLRILKNAKMRLVTEIKENDEEIGLRPLHDFLQDCSPETLDFFKTKQVDTRRFCTLSRFHLIELIRPLPREQCIIVLNSKDLLEENPELIFFGPGRLRALGRVVFQDWHLRHVNGEVQAARKAQEQDERQAREAQERIEYEARERERKEAELLFRQQQQEWERRRRADFERHRERQRLEEQHQRDLRDREVRQKERAQLAAFMASPEAKRLAPCTQEYITKCDIFDVADQIMVMQALPNAIARRRQIRKTNLRDDKPDDESPVTLKEICTLNCNNHDFWESVGVGRSALSMIVSEVAASVLPRYRPY